MSRVEFTVVGRGAVSRSLEKNAELQVKLLRAIQERSFYNRLRERLLGQKAGAGFKGVKSGTEITEEGLDALRQRNGSFRIEDRGIAQVAAADQQRRER